MIYICLYFQTIHCIDFQGITSCLQVRFRRQPELRDYREPHYRQKLLLASCEPVFSRTKRLPSEKCGDLKPNRTETNHHPYDVLLSKDLSEELETSQLVCWFHQNQMSKQYRKLLANEFEHQGLKIRFYNRDILNLATENNHLESLRRFAVGYHFTILFAPDLTKVEKIIKISKKYPQICLIGAMVDKRRFLTVKQLQNLALLGDLDHQRSLLCSSILNSCSQALISDLNKPGILLCQTLDSLSKSMNKSID